MPRVRPRLRIEGIEILERDAVAERSHLGDGSELAKHAEGLDAGAGRAAAEGTWLLVEMAGRRVSARDNAGAAGCPETGRRPHVVLQSAHRRVSGVEGRAERS